MASTLEKNEWRNKHHDTFYSDFPIANNFLEILRKRCIDTDIYLSNHIWFDSYSKKKQIYVRSTIMDEIFIGVIHKYLIKLSELGIVTNIYWAIPRFAVEAISFNINSKFDEHTDFDAILPSSSDLHNLLRESYINFQKRAIKHSFVDKNNMSKYLETILLCVRKNICSNTEDIIHEFLGNKPINRWNSVMQMSKEISYSDKTYTTDELHRAWQSVVKMDIY